VRKPKSVDPFLEERHATYQAWLDQGQISFSSKVIPVAESLDAEQWVLPTEQALTILRDARSVALQDCECRSHYGRCDGPLEVCLLLNDVGDQLVARGEARHVSLDEAADVLKKANQSGLVHLTLYRPDHQVYAICSCCWCCCHDLQIIRLYEQKELMVHSDYVAVTDVEACIQCSACVDRCMFDARVSVDGGIDDNPRTCVGCGLCVTVCPVEAIVMALRSDQETEL